MEPFWTENFGNPNALYKEGLTARNAVETAREDVVKVLGARAKEIIFTVGGTESDNLAIFGVIKNFKNGHIITTKFEHHAVLNTCKFLEKQGFEVTYLNVGKDGVVNPEEVKRALKPETILVSIMYANNEIGTVQPIREIAKVIRIVKKKRRGNFVPLRTDEEGNPTGTKIPPPFFRYFTPTLAKRPVILI